MESSQRTLMGAAAFVGAGYELRHAASFEGAGVWARPEEVPSGRDPLVEEEPILAGPRRRPFFFMFTVVENGDGTFEVRGPVPVLPTAP